VNVLEVCEDQTLDATLSWSGGIGPYEIDELTDVIDLSTSVGLSDLAAGTYNYSLNDAMGCEAEVQLVINSVSDPDCSCSVTAEVGDDQEITRYQETVILDASASSQGSDFGYAWYDADGNLLSTENQYETDQPGTYRFETTDLVNNCIAIKEVKVTDIRNEIQTVVITQSDILCHGEQTGIIEIMDVEGGTPTYNFFVDQMPIDDPKMEELPAGDYAIRIVDAADCYYDTLITLSEPQAILAGPEISEQTVTQGRDVEVNIETNLAQEDIARVIWTPAIDCDNCLAYTFDNVQEDLRYQVTIVDKNNCEASLDLRIIVNSELALYLPNIINPNSEDNGIFFPQTANETFMVKEMNIYDRWGNLVFANNNFAVNDPAHGWDGTFNSGQAEIGVYLYTIVLENESKTIQLSGDVTLLK